MAVFINLKEILEQNGVTKQEIAALLFPKAKFPRRALARILGGESEISVSQAALLAKRLGVRIEDLFEPDRWTWSKREDKENFVFLYGHNFRAEVNVVSWKTKLYYKDEVIAEVEYDSETTVSEFFSRLRKIVLDWIDLT